MTSLLISEEALLQASPQVSTVPIADDCLTPHMNGQGLYTRWGRMGQGGAEWSKVGWGKVGWAEWGKMGQDGARWGIVGQGCVRLD